MVEEVVGHLLSQFHLYQDLSFRTIVLRPERQQHSADNQAEQAEEGQNCKRRIFYCGQNQPLVLRKQLGQVPLAVFDLQKGSP